MKRHFPGTFFPAVDIGFHCKSGAIILTIIGNIMNLSSAVSVYLNGVVQGVIIIAAVLLQRGVTTKR